MIEIDERVYGGAEIAALSGRMGERLGLGTSPDVRYAVCLPNAAEWLALLLAVRAANASVLPIHPATPYAAARRLAGGAGAHVLLFGARAPEALADAAPAPRGELLQMSSGTTGAPKVVARSWADIGREIEAYVGAFREPDGMTPVVACPTTHSYGLICGVLVALARGAAPVVVEASNPKYLAKRLRELERPLLYSSPAVLHALARLWPEGARMHAVMTSGALLPEPWFKAIRAKSERMFQQYGCSEAGCVAINPDVAAADEMGFSLPHLRVEAGASAAAPAEIVVHGARGRVATRDLGHLRPDGMLTFTARLDDTINVAGLNVYPQEIEDVVTAMAGVTDAVAFRMADRFAGERVGLIYSADRPVEAAAIRDWCRAHLAGHQLPTEIVHVEAAPRQANGKVSRRDVAARHAAGAFRARVPEEAR